MEKKRNLCAMVSTSIFNRFGAERDKAGLTNSEFATKILEEYFSVKDKEGNVMAQNNGETRTLAFQIPASLFQRIKDYLKRETKRRGRKITQRDFVLGLIEQALDEAEREAARTEEPAAGQSDGADAQPEPGAESPDEEPEADADGEAETEDDGEDTEDGYSAESAENAHADAVEDADSADGSRPPEGN
jgi:hypothetical protein